MFASSTKSYSKPSMKSSNNINNNNKDSDLPHCWLPARSKSLNSLLMTSSSSSSSSSSPQKLIVPTSALYDLVRAMNWHRVIRHCRTHPVDADYQHQSSSSSGGTLETPLHLACKLRPSVRVIREMLHASSRMACEMTTQNGELPLHIACRHNASIQVLRELTRTHPEIAQKRENNSNSCGGNKTALQVLWDARESIRSNHDENEDFNSIFWQKIIVLLQAVARSRQVEHGGLASSKRKSRTSRTLSSSSTTTSSSTSTLYMLHAAVSLGSDGCPREVLDYCLQQYSHQVAQRDASGRLPLHIAVAIQPSSSCHERLPKISASTVDGGGDATESNHYQTSVISKLLALYPRAAKIPDPNEPNGRYPLHSAVANHIAWQHGVSDLIEEAPDVICMPDPVSRLLPFLSAAAAVVGAEPAVPAVVSPPAVVGRQRRRNTRAVVDLDSIYCLLRALPSALDAKLAAQAPVVVTSMEEQEEVILSVEDNVDVTERTMDESTEMCFDDSFGDLIFQVRQQQQQQPLPLPSSFSSSSSAKSSWRSRRNHHNSNKSKSSSSISKEPPIRLPRVQRADHRELCDDVVQRIASSGLFGAMRMQKRRSNLLKIGNQQSSSNNNLITV